MEKQKNICQCCGMPLTDEVLGTNKDGSKNEEYCSYCLADGKFTYDTIAEIIEVSTPILVAKGFKEDEAKKFLAESLPNLKHWSK